MSAEDRARVTVRWPSQYQWRGAARWVAPLRYGLSRLARIVQAPIPQRHDGIVSIVVELAGEAHEVVIDYSDHLEFNPELLDQAALYFKMQCPIDGDPRLIPGGYVTYSQRIYRWLPRLRALRDRHDFEFDVYGRFGLEFAGQLRRQAVSLLREQDRFGYDGGLKVINHPAYLREIARARICIDLPGNGPLCFRQMDCLAIGACIIGPKPPVRLPVEPRNGLEIVYTEPDLSDLVELCDRYLRDEQAREAIALNARAYFDRHINRHQLGAYYLSVILSRLG